MGLFTNLYRSVMGKRGGGRRPAQQREEGLVADVAPRSPSSVFEQIRKVLPKSWVLKK
jgi:hypothetical protein